MNNSHEISRQAARTFILRHQGLLPPRQLRTKDDILALIRRLGCIQYDPLNIVGNNPELVLQSRVKNFKSGMLAEMLYTDRVLLDDWDKMMAIYPVEDRPYFHHRQVADANGSHRRNIDQIRDIAPEIRKEVETRGPLSSIDLDHDQKVNWPWGPTRLARAALEDLYYRGDLIIHHRVHTRKYYDLASRHLPPEILDAPDPHATIEAYHDWHVHRRIRSVGLVWNRPGPWHGIYHARTPEIKAAIGRLIGRGELVSIGVQGIDHPFFLSIQDMPLLSESQENGTGTPEASVIAPLDNLLWDREMVQELFGFTYRWEVYKPVKEREYGYYVLPVLYGDRFIARFEPVREKRTGVITIKNWWWEDGAEPDTVMKTALSECFSEFRDYLGTAKIRAGRSRVARENLDWLPK